MPLPKPLRLVITALSHHQVDIKKTYKLARTLERATRRPVLKTVYEPWDHVIVCGDHRVPVRVFRPDADPHPGQLLLFFHGGGWVSGDIETYSDTCVRMSRFTGCIVVSVDYRLAPEHRFPAGLDDCYYATQELLENAAAFGCTRQDVTLIGDSAGGNLAAAVSLRARDSGALVPCRQILIYPSTYNDHNPATSPFASVRCNGEGNLLTARAVEDYVDLYKARDADLTNPYLAPLLADDLSRQPDTLVITAELDPLRDEGQAYGERLLQAGNKAQVHCIPDALHGYLSSLGPGAAAVQQTYALINAFLPAQGRSPQSRPEMAHTVQAGGDSLG